MRDSLEISPKATKHRGQRLQSWASSEAEQVHYARGTVRSLSPIQFKRLERGDWSPQGENLLQVQGLQFQPAAGECRRSQSQRTQGNRFQRIHPCRFAVSHYLHSSIIILHIKDGRRCCMERPCNYPVVHSGRPGAPRDPWLLPWFQWVEPLPPPAAKCSERQHILVGRSVRPPQCVHRQHG
jgi:hypothetical protein